MWSLVEHCATCLQYLIWASWNVSSSGTGSTLLKKTVYLMDSGKDVEVKIHVLQAIQIHLVTSHTVDNCE